MEEYMKRSQMRGLRDAKSLYYKGELKNFLPLPQSLRKFPETTKNHKHINVVHRQYDNHMNDK